eukprot:TRINITY_DN91092_c0_g1_i1.p1 TRINITY_DN91092_c0_g1~~TRINITY_DN91092_c0_g1_i1.p1  ORF type:complete len:1110 (+),score=265.31 TRINITY_DN91092_c0_g1_i1:69-3398(+)
MFSSTCRNGYSPPVLEFNNDSSCPELERPCSRLPESPSTVSLLPSPGQKDEECARFAFVTKKLSTPTSTASPGQTSLPVSPCISDVPVRAAPSDFESLIEYVNASDDSAIRALLKTKMACGKYDYKGRINELTDFADVLKMAVMQQITCLKDIRQALVPIGEQMNMRLSIAAEEARTTQLEMQRLSLELAAARQRSNSAQQEDDAARKLRAELQLEKAKAVSEWSQRMDNFQVTCRKEVADVTDAYQKQLEHSAQEHHTQLQMLLHGGQEQTRRIADLGAERDQLRQECERLREDAHLAASREDKLLEKDGERQRLMVRLADMSKALQQKDDEVIDARAALEASKAQIEKTENLAIAIVAELTGRGEFEAGGVRDSLFQGSAEVAALRAQCEEKETVVRRLQDNLNSMEVKLRLASAQQQMLQGRLDERERVYSLELQRLHGLSCDKEALQTVILEKEAELKAKREERHSLLAQLEKKEVDVQQEQAEKRMVEALLRQKEEVLQQKDVDLREALQSIRQIHGDNSEQLQFERQRVQRLEAELHSQRESELTFRESSRNASHELALLRSSLDASEAEKVRLAEAAAQAQAAAKTHCEQLQRVREELHVAKMEHVRAQEVLQLTSEEVAKLAVSNQQIQQQMHDVRDIDQVGSQEQARVIDDLKAKVENLSKELTAKHIELTKQKGSSVMQKQYTVGLERRLADVERERRHLHNQVQDLKGSIRVFCRVRPVLEGVEGSVQATDDGKVNVSYGSETYSFNYDKVFGASSSQLDVFEEVSGLVQSALDGYKVCIFAYGQTGSGKTFTMQGPLEQDHWGLIPRSLSLILEASKDMASQGWAWSLEACFFEVYNEVFRDLLRPSSGSFTPRGCGSSPVVHTIQHDDAWGAIVTNMTTVQVDSLEQIRELTARAAKQRAVGSHDMNAESSRSHSVFALYLKGVNSKLNSELHGALHLVDLAGSERLDKTGSHGERLRETQNINRSLSSLSDVFLAKAERRNHVPYRNSKLTHLMEPCLSGQGKTLMLVTVGPEATNAQETLCSLRFAGQVNKCNTGGKAKRTVFTLPTANMRRSLDLSRLHSLRGPAEGSSVEDATPPTSSRASVQRMLSARSAR